MKVNGLNFLRYVSDDIVIEDHDVSMEMVFFSQGQVFQSYDYICWSAYYNDWEGYDERVGLRNIWTREPYLWWDVGIYNFYRTHEVIIIERYT